MKISLTFLFFPVWLVALRDPPGAGKGPPALPTSPVPRPPRQDYLTSPSLRDRETGSWIPAHHPRSVRERTGSRHRTLPARVDWARRNPRLLFRLSGLFLFRFAE